MSDETSSDGREQRFLSALVTTMVERDWGMFKALKAANGFLMREQAEDSHPGQAERIAAVSLPHIEADMQEPWLFGFRFRDSDHTGSARQSERTLGAEELSPSFTPAAAAAGKGAAAAREGMRPALEGAAVSEALASTPPLAALPAAVPEGIVGALGQEPTSTPRADLRGAHLYRGNGRIDR